jgi:predicted RNA polymerase sigma factor
MNASKRLQMLEGLIAKGSLDPFVHYARAMELRASGQPEVALAAYADVRARFADYVPTYLMAAQVAVELGRVDEARSWLEQGIAAASAARDDHAKSELLALRDQLG